jgi:molecular chaperone GrpE
MHAQGTAADAAAKERLLNQLRQYLDGVEALPVPAPDLGSAEADLFTVFVELAAVRNEVRTEARLVKEALDQFRTVFGTLQSSHATLERELKRVQAEARERAHALLRPLLLDLLDLRDRLDAALQAQAGPPSRWLDRWLKPRAAPEHWREGIGITARRLDRMLAERRVSRIESIGQRFDPRLARAVGARRDANVAPGIVVEEVRAGYLWDDEPLRIAEVIVSNASGGDNEP